MWTTMKNNLLGKKISSCSFYLYRFRKYVSYGFPIISFCNPRVHYETPCILPATIRIICFRKRWIFQFKNFVYLHRRRNTIFRRVRKIAKSDFQIRHVCPSVQTEQLGSHRTGFHEIRYLSIFRKSVEKIQDSLKSDKNTGHFTWRTMYIFDHILFSSSYNEICFQKKICWETRNTHFMMKNVFFFLRKSCCLWDKVEKYCRAGQATDDNTAHAHCRLNT